MPKQAASSLAWSFIPRKVTGHGQAKRLEEEEKIFFFENIGKLCNVGS